MRGSPCTTLSSMPVCKAPPGPPPPLPPNASERFNAFWKVSGSTTGTCEHNSGDDSSLCVCWPQYLPLPSPGSRPVLHEEEVECIMRDQVEIVDGTTGRRAGRQARVAF